jgi:branched-chain amino acid transport system substrate-binding protein
MLSMTITRRRLLAGAAGTASILAAPAIGRAQVGPLKVGVLLPRSGVQAGIGRDCHRAVEIAPAIFKEIKLPDLAIINADTESSVEIARSRAEKLVSEGAQLLIGAFDSGQTTAIAQVAEQRGIPFVVNIAAAPQITEQGYKFVFRSFPTAAMILRDGFANQIEVFEASGVAPKSVVFMHVNDTYGMAMVQAISSVISRFNVPYKIVETIGYDPAARDLAIEVAKAKATGAEALMMSSRLNDAILVTRELIKQRWTPMAVLSMGPGWYDDSYFKTLGKLSDGPISFVPWQDANKPLAKRLDEALRKAYPEVNLSTNHVFTFEALLVAADAYKRAGSTDPKALADAIRQSNITDNVSIGPGILFNAKGQNEKLTSAAIQNREGKPVVVAPKFASVVSPQVPMTPYDKR